MVSLDTGLKIANSRRMRTLAKARGIKTSIRQPIQRRASHMVKAIRRKRLPYSAVMEERAVAAAVGGVKELQQRSLISWIIDSGCSTHMVSSEELLFDIKWESKRVIVPGGRTLNAVGIGRIKGLVESTDEEGGGKNIEVSFQ